MVFNLENTSRCNHFMGRGNGNGGGGAGRQCVPEITALSHLSESRAISLLQGHQNLSVCDHSIINTIYYDSG